MFAVFQSVILCAAFAGLALALAVLAARSRTVSAVLERLLTLWRSLTHSGRVAAVSLLTICVLYGGSKTNSPPMMMRPAAPVQLTYAEKKARNWNVRGAWRDSFCLKFADGWRFPSGTNHLYGVEVISFGQLWPTPFNTNAVASLGSRVEIVPGLSSFSYESTPSNSYRFMWGSAAINRDTNDLVIASLELFRNGDIAVTTNGVTKNIPRELPADWGDPGIDDFYGNDNTLPDEADEGAYYWIDLVVSNAAAKVTFNGDKPSNYSDPEFVANNDSTNRVTLLIGKPYTVTCDEAIGVTATSSDDVLVTRVSENEIDIVWPVEFDMEEYQLSSYALSRSMTQVPVAGGFSITSFPFLNGYYVWDTNVCCNLVSNKVDGVWNYSCNANCSCMGCSFGGAFHYEGYWLEVTGVSCGCSYREELGATAGISFAGAAVIFENCYTNAPNDIVPRRSTTNSLNISVYGGPYGGEARIEFDDNGKLEYLTSDEIPRSFSVAPGETVTHSLPFTAKEESATEDDITASLVFTEYVSGNVIESEDEMTSVRVEIEPWVTKEGCVNRHLVGVKEMILCVATPNVGQWKENGGGGFPLQGNYECPLTIDDSVLYYEIDGDAYDLELKIVEPERIVAIDPVVKDFSVPENMAGGAGMNLKIYIHPLSVSFSRISMEEVPSWNGNFGGYFTNVYFSNVWHHTVEMGAGKWVNIDPYNYWDTDRAWMGDILPRELSNGEMTSDLHDGAWRSGTLIWRIPWGWQEVNAQIGDVPIKTLGTRYDQVFEINQSGTLSVVKFGYIVSRGTNNVFRLNGNVVQPKPLTQEDLDAVN